MPRKNLMPPDPVESLAKRIHDEVAKVLPGLHVPRWGELQPVRRAQILVMAEAMLNDPPPLANARKLAERLHDEYQRDQKQREQWTAELMPLKSFPPKTIDHYVRMAEALIANPPAELLVKPQPAALPPRKVTF